MEIYLKQHYNSYSWITFFILMLYSIILSISSNSMIWLWISLELNTMFFIPLLQTFNNLKSSEQIMKYFLIQSVSSNMILLCFLSSFLIMKFISFKFNLLIYIFLVLKMGSAPMMHWLMNFIEEFKWVIFMIMTTLQKIIPFNMFIMIFNIKIMLILSLINSWFGSFLGLSQLSLRKIMMFSSLNHLSWTILALSLSMKMFKFYFFFYFLMTCFQCYIFNFLKINFLHQMFLFEKNLIFNNFNMKKSSIMMLIIYFMSLPPILGIFPKFMIIFKTEIMIYTLILFMIFMNLISLSFYSRMIISFTLNSHLILKPQTIMLNQNSNFLKMILFMILNFMWLLFFLQKII